MSIDFSKFVKYSKPGPRYTSYPTAPEFSDAFGYNDYINFIKKSNDSKRPLSLYFHLPFCRSACYFCGCNVVYTSKPEKRTRYIDYLKREMDILATHLDTRREVIQLHFGGGTPTFFTAEELDEIISYIKKHFTNFIPDAELSCEIDPRYFNEPQMQVLKKHGFNRISFGVQDFDPKVQEAVHRVQPFDQTKAAVDLARLYGIDSINVDLIYGLPYQTLESFIETVRLTLELDPDRLAVFNYAHVPWMMKTMRKIDETTLPTPDVKLQILKGTMDYITSHGYNTVGMDHFAKPEDELFRAIEKGELHRNFQGYTTKGGADLIGVGITSIGETEDYYAQNFKDMDEWEGAIDSGRLPLFRGIALSEDDKIRKDVIMQLMSNFKLDFKTIEARHGIEFKTYFADALGELKPFEAEGLITLDENGLAATPTGTMIIRNLSMPFDAYLKKIPEAKRQFSKTV